MKNFHPLLIFSFLVFLLTSVQAQGNEHEDAVIRIKGSDTLSKVLKEWTRTYQEHNPKVRIELSGGGSSNGIAALINSHIELAASSRLLRPHEIHLVIKKSGVRPVSHEVARDAISVVVHPSNPLNAVSLQHLMEIYGKHKGEPLWSDLGVNVPGCQDQKILSLSRKNNSGTYLFFRQAILDKNDHFNSQIVSMDGSASVVSMVSQTPCAIGYAGMAYITGAVKTLCISRSHNLNTPCVPPTVATTLDKSYPLARALYLYSLGPPKGEVLNFLEWIRGPVGKEILVRNGYVSPP
ncbi:MAG: phosphate ABC transporter substrate-binding protein [Magnetococcales bacterium]|nr:phosphate ABC transporter substrate-binding protein [Magnetococcales bacterium]MBF0439081.1 phosphate ABC transporter substrate-binding protein [Magnetococcales bacterium]